MSLNDDIYMKVRNWIFYIINTEGGREIPIVQSRQNTPAPEGTYITVDRFVDVTNMGRATKNYPPDDTGKTKVVTDYEGTIEIWEIDGAGDYLRELVSSIERAEIQDTYFRKENISIRGVIGITGIPRLDNDFWTEQAMMELRIGFADVTTEQSGWIDTVELNNNITH